MEITYRVAHISCSIEICEIITADRVGMMEHSVFPATLESARVEVVWNLGVGKEAGALDQAQSGVLPPAQQVIDLVNKKIDK